MSNPEKEAQDKEQQEPLSEDQLENVSAGLNPQPLPPIVDDRF